MPPPKKMSMKMKKPMHKIKAKKGEQNNMAWESSRKREEVFQISKTLLSSVGQIKTNKSDGV